MPACETNLESVFQPGPVILDYKDLKYNPFDEHKFPDLVKTNDLIFPSIIKTTNFSKPLNAYYMYYAPHNSPGGICMAHAPSIEGPWTEFVRENRFITANPVIAKDWPPHYRVGHVSAPHAIWVAGESKLFVYYHGDNDQTHYATSKNGIDFEYGGVAVDQKSYADYVEGKYDRVFYGRVFEHRIPSKDNKYVFLWARESTQGKHLQGIYLSHSMDARKWSTPVRIMKPFEGATFLCSPCLFTVRGRHYIAYHAEVGNKDAPATDTYVDEFDAELAVGKPLGKLLDHSRFWKGNYRAADPLILFEGKVVYLVVSTDTRLNQRIAFAKAPLADLERALASHG
jgi:hypothetical protein